MTSALRNRVATCLLCLLTSGLSPALVPSAAAAQTIDRPSTPVVEVVVDIQVHGNNATADEDVRSIAAVAVGESFSDALLEAVRRRLESSGRFESVEVRKRYASIVDPSRISLVIIVNDRAVRVEATPSGEGGDEGRGVRIRRRSALGRAMFLPWLEDEDGYGLAYGGVIAYPGVGSERARITFPLTWGGRKRAAVEYDRSFTSGAVGRVRSGVARERRPNPAFEEDDDRSRLWARIESRLKWNAGLGATAAAERVSFQDDRENWKSIALDATLDTRADPAFPRNAVLATVSRTFLSGDRHGRLDRTEAGIEGFLGLIAKPVLALRLDVEGANRPLPLYFRPLLGGWTSVRGFRAGSFHGDKRLVTSAELRVPLSSPVSISRVGFSLFLDRGKVFDVGQHPRDVPWRTGYGAGVWVSAAMLQVGISVGHAHGAGTRLTAGVSLGQ